MGKRGNMPFERERRQMLADIEAEVALTRELTGRDHLDESVMTAMSHVHREDFVPDTQRHASFRNGALPVGYGQTISQPYIVALMTDLLDLKTDSVVLEIGSGTGYQTAILAELASKVFSIERIPELAQAAQQRLKDLDYENVEIRCADGSLGWPEHAPFDGIIVTAAAASVPPALLAQLKPGGRMVIPIGLPHMHQDLMVVTSDQQGKAEIKKILGVAFVPLVEGS
jgi:protein-L-isoaspartate(D-aspartate) O-methyltransferase